MNNNQQRLAIAKACGWTDIKQHQHGVYWTGTRPRQPEEDEAQLMMAVSNYLNDLNAMHEAEKVLDDDQWLEYMLNLMDVCQRHFDLGKWTCVQVCMSATAAQRAEAFLRTLSLWEDSSEPQAH